MVQTITHKITVLHDMSLVLFFFQQVSDQHALRHGVDMVFGHIHAHTSTLQTLFIHVTYHSFSSYTSIPPPLTPDCV